MPDLLFRALERASRGRRAGFDVEWRETWDSRASGFYHALGGEDWLPESLLAHLCADQSDHLKRVALVTREGSPWAVAPMRWNTRFWRPLLYGICPPFPEILSCGGLPETMAALNAGVSINLGREDPAGVSNLRWASSAPNYELPLHAPPERYWRTTERWKSVVQARRRSAAFVMVRDDAPSVEWIIRTWRRRWSTGRPADTAAQWRDRLTFNRWGLKTGAVKSWALFDGERPAAGIITVAHGRRVNAQTIVRDRDYDWYGLGNRLLAEAAMDAFESGMERIAFGGRFPYKRWWAPQAGVSHSYILAPFPLHVANWAFDRIDGLGRQLRS
ncbi:MAG: GNAT family N-acetyltransferase [Dehalococcoidia bacterium]|nr:GNAT family N-acetyltransferase [Dehalococcoidia bacterium]